MKSFLLIGSFLFANLTLKTNAASTGQYPSNVQKLDLFVIDSHQDSSITRNVNLPSSINDTLLAGGKKLFFDSHDFLLLGMDVHGNSMRLDTIWNFNDIVDTAWKSTKVNFSLDNENQTVLIETWEVTSTYPWYDVNSRSFVNVPVSFIQNHQSEESAGVISKRAKVSTKFKWDSDKKTLTYKLVNPMALKDKVIFSFYDQSGKLVLEFKPVSSNGEIALKELKESQYQMKVSSTYSSETYVLIAD